MYRRTTRPAAPARICNLFMLLLVFGTTWPLRALADLPTALKAYDKGDFETALNEFLDLTKLGQPQAQYNVAVM